MWVGNVGAELAEELAKLPDSLTSLYPDVGADFLYSVFKDCVDDVLRGKEGEAVAKRTRGRVERNAGVSKNDLKKKKKTIKEEENEEEHVDFCLDGEKLAEAKEYKDKIFWALGYEDLVKRIGEQKDILNLCSEEIINLQSSPPIYGIKQIIDTQRHHVKDDIDWMEKKNS